MDIAEHIVKMRNKYKISQYKLAQLAGISQPTLSDIEAGNNQPSFSTIDKIALALDCSLSEFFSGVQREIYPELQELINTAQTLTPLQLEKLNEFIKALK